MDHEVKSRSPAKKRTVRSRDPWTDLRPRDAYADASLSNAQNAARIPKETARQAMKPTVSTLSQRVISHDDFGKSFK
ncbi:MAG: hypothetical protein ACREIA_04385 [Opitutaceae bacterium]